MSWILKRENIYYETAEDKRYLIPGVACAMCANFTTQDGHKLPYAEFVPDRLVKHYGTCERVTQPVKVNAMHNCESFRPDSRCNRPMDMAVSIAASSVREARNWEEICELRASIKRRMKTAANMRKTISSFREKDPNYTHLKSERSKAERYRNEAIAELLKTQEALRERDKTIEQQKGVIERESQALSDALKRLRVAPADRTDLNRDAIDLRDDYIFHLSAALNAAGVAIPPPQPGSGIMNRKTGEVA
jgi:hypothetical protein